MLVYRDVSTLSGVLMLLTEDMDIGYKKGFKCFDVAESAEDRCVFMCKVCLLCVGGDTPALGLLSGFTHAGGAHCHYCKIISAKDMALNRMYPGHFRQWLGRQNSMRLGGRSTTAERRMPPELREPDECVPIMASARCWIGVANQHPSKTTGIYNWCPLVRLPLFDVIWDITADLMHHIQYYPRHAVKAMKGNVVIKASMLSLQVKGTAFREPGNLEAETARRKKENMRRVARVAATEEVKVVVYIIPDFSSSTLVIVAIVHKNGN